MYDAAVKKVSHVRGSAVKAVLSRVLHTNLVTSSPDR